jgi:bifunctional oligoribonuclease and PAP phosphatase NrnA
MIDFKNLQKIIEENSIFLLTCHVNPDADAIGSEIALYNVLKKMGKKSYIINHSETPYNLLFLDKDHVIEKFSEEKHSSLFNEADVLVGLDFNRSDRLVSMKNDFNNSTQKKICIDHHQDPEKFVDHYFVDPEYSSTGEIIYDFIKQTGIVKLNEEIAEPIYAAIMTDTGSFRFERTTPTLHLIISDLLKAGADPTMIYDSIYDQSRISKIKLLGRALAGLQLHNNSQEIAYMRISQKDFIETGAVESDTDSFVNYSLSIENVKIGILFIELKDGFKVSFRSKGKIPINKLAGEFGGGGHTNAAGARFHNSDLNKMFPIILNTAEKYLTVK